MRLLKNGKFSGLGKGCHTVDEAGEVIDPANEAIATRALGNGDEYSRALLRQQLIAEAFAEA